MSTDEVEVCRAFRNNGSCRFGENCKFEHSEGEPIPPPTERRERGECFNWNDAGECTHGEKCRFTHGADDTRHTGDISEEVCRNYQRGRCNFGTECRRKHEGPVREQGERAERQPRAKGICFTFRDEGACERDGCHFSHTTGDEEEPVSSGRSRRRGGRRKQGGDECFAFRDAGYCERGEECRFSHGPAAEGAAAPAQRSAPGQCYDFRDGTCERENCRFSHDDSAPAPRARRRGACFAFAEGNCERGDECRFTHGGEDESFDTAPRNQRPVKKIDEECNNWKEGNCRLGERCRRIHVAL